MNIKIDIFDVNLSFPAISLNFFEKPRYTIQKHNYPEVFPHNPA